MRSSIFGVAVVALVVVVGAEGVSAQNAQITGSVKDQTGGVMPGTTVTAKNKGTGLSRSEVTDGAGDYRLPALPPGTYDVTAELQGFNTETRPDIVIGIDQNATINFTLKTASLAETITVTGDSPVVDVTRSEVSTSITSRAIQDLPIAARRWIDMAMLTPGASQDNIRGQFYRGNVSIGAGVTNFYSTGVLVDGVSNNWSEMGEPRQNFPMDAIQEFNVSTSSFKAEYGLATGGVLNVVTKSGTNDLHFSGFLFYRNAALTERQFFQTSTPPYSRYQYGGTIGGPIIKDKLHYFFTYERTDENVYNTVNTRGVWPQYDGTYKSAQLHWTYLGRLDHQLNANQSLFFRQAQEWEFRPGISVGGSITPSGSQDFAIPRTSAVMGHTWVISTTSLNDFRFQYAYSKYVLENPGSGEAYDAGDFPPSRLTPAGGCTPVYNYPSLTLGSCNTQMGPEHRYQIKDNYSFQVPRLRGKHQFKAGFDFSYIPFLEDNTTDFSGTWTFPLDKPYDANNTATWPTQYRQSLPRYGNLPTTYYGLYLQDDWEATAGLTFNLGIRYDRQLNAFNEDITKSLQLISEKLGPQFAQYPIPIPFIDTSVRGPARNWGPRAGFAWDPGRNGLMNIHAAYGVYFDNMRVLANANELTWPQAQQIIISRPSFPDPLQGKSRDAFISTAPPNITVLDNYAVNPWSRSFDVGMTRQLARDIGITADFTSVNRYQDQSSVDLNLPDAVTKVKPYPQFARVTQLQSAMNTTYRALFIKLDKHFGHRWSALVSYTLSAARDQPIANDLGGVYGYAREDGYSLADRRHKLVTSGMVALPGDLQVSAILDLRTAQPFNPATSTDINKDGYTSDIPIGVGFRSGCRDLNLDAINALRPSFGLAPVSSVACPGFANLDLRFSKSFRMQSHRLELIGQLFNVTNRANFATAVSNPLSSAFGQVNQLVPFINAPSRQAELAIRFQF